jgi:hypothetical protein
MQERSIHVSYVGYGMKGLAILARRQVKDSQGKSYVQEFL